MYIYIYIYICMDVCMNGCNKKIVLVKYLEKYTLDQNVKKYGFSVLEKAISKCEN